MKKLICLSLLFAAMAGCGENDDRRRQPDPRFEAAGGCLNDSTDQEMFDENGKVYYEYIPCPDKGTS